MSRIGKQIIAIPSGVEVTLDASRVRVKGPNGDITKDFSHIRGIKVSVEKKKIIFTTNFPKSGTLALTKTGDRTLL